MKSELVSRKGASNVPLRGAQDSVIQIHQHLVDISRLACQTNDELAQHQSSYKQAYLSEHQKLLDMTAAHNALADASSCLERENGYLKQQLILKYHSDLKRQQELSLEAQIHTRTLEAKLEVLERMGYDEQQKHTRALKVATSLLNMQTQRIEALEKEIDARSTARSAAALQVSTAQVRRSSRLRGATSVQPSERTLRGRKSAQLKAEAKK